MLRIEIAVEDAAAGQTRWDAIEFSIPADFHAHNDAVAAALMTLVGTTYQAVSFNFPISSSCAETLQAAYPGVVVGPADPSLEPRRPGQRIGLSFSGGLDSTGALALLRALEVEPAVITSAYEHFDFEARGYSHHHRDITCHTNLRCHRLDRSGRFNSAVPLLHADYLGLGMVTTGHTVNLSGDCLLLPGEVERPTFLQSDLVVNAAGLQELHLVRSLHNHGLSRLLMYLAPQWIEIGLSGTHRPTSEKYYTKAWIFTYLYRQAGLPLPGFLAQLVWPRRSIPFGLDIGMDLRMLHMAKHADFHQVRRICPDLGSYDLTFLRDIELRFLERYHPTIAALLPQDLRPKVLDLFEAAGILPYDAHDWQEIAAVRAFLASIDAHYL
ncbi:MAG: hypothetical protein DCC58_20335 [Chloroflexi bacterium]|nr:MAG: hypothetical protein DCC58_20335 [Chloroflexota bacterium]